MRVVTVRINSDGLPKRQDSLFKLLFLQEPLPFDGKRRSRFYRARLGRRHRAIRGNGFGLGWIEFWRLSHHSDEERDNQRAQDQRDWTAFARELQVQFGLG